MARACWRHSFQVKNPLQVSSVHLCESTFASCFWLAQLISKKIGNKVSVTNVNLIFVNGIFMVNSLIKLTLSNWF